MCQKGNTAETPLLIIKLAAPGADMNIKEAAQRNVAEQKHHCPLSTIHCPLWPVSPAQHVEHLVPAHRQEGGAHPLDVRRVDAAEPDQSQREHWGHVTALRQSELT